MIASTMLVTICGPLKTLDLELPGDVAVRELIPLLLVMCGSGQDSSQAIRQEDVHLQVAGRTRALPLEKTLTDADVCDGMVLVLQTASSPAGESIAPQQFMPRSVQPGVDTGGVGVMWTPLV